MIGKGSKRATKAPAAKNTVRAAAPPTPTTQSVVESKSRPRRSSEPTHDEIAARAYELWLERGGNEIVNWLEAENELRQTAKR